MTKNGKMLAWGGGALVLVALAAVGAPPPVSAVNMEAAHKAKREAMLVKAKSLDLPSDVMCVGRRVSDTTVQTSYDLFLYEDATHSPEESKAATDDIFDAYLGPCGGSAAAITATAQKDADALTKGFILAMLKEGRQ